MFELLLFSLFGITLGIIAGILPGLHINNILPFILFLSYYFDPQSLVVLISSMVASQLVFNFFINVFLGAADNEENSLSLLPTHKLLLKGKGIQALFALMLGSLLGFLISIILFFPLSLIFTNFYSLVRSIIPFILIFVVSYIILLEFNLRKILLSTLVFLISGIFGYISLSFVNLKQELILFPIFTGAFGISSLITSIYTKTKIPKQELNFKLNEKFNKILLSSLLGTIGGILVGVLPGIGVAQATIIVNSLFGFSDEIAYLASLGAINSSDNIFSLLSLYLVGNPRSGASIYIEKIVGDLTINIVLLIIAFFGISLVVSSFLLLKISKKFLKGIEKINYQKISTLIISFLIFLTFLFSGFKGLFLLAIATIIGILTIRLNVNRSLIMGVLIFPTIILFW